MMVTRSTKNALRRQEITEAAIRVIARLGWAEASIDEIMREAGFSRGLASYHFKDKTELLSAVLSRCHEFYDETIALAVAGSDDQLEQLRLSLRTALQLARENPAPYLVFLHFAADARTHPELGEQLRLMYADFRQRIAAGLRVGQQRGVYRPDLDPEAAAALLTGTLVGVALQYLIDPLGYPFERTASAVEQFLLSALTGVPCLPASPLGIAPSIAAHA